MTQRRSLLSGLLWLSAAILLLGACASPEIRPDDRESKAAELLREGDIDGSLTLFREAMIANPESFLALVGAATCFAHKGDAARFEATAIRAASIAPRNVDGWAQVGRLYVRGAERFRRTGRSRIYAELGVGYLRQVFGVDPRHPGVVENLGVGLLLKEDFRTARVLLAEVHRQAPERLDVSHSLLQAYRGMDDREAARELIEEVRGRRGKIPPAWLGVERWSREKPAPRGSQAPRR